MTTRTKAKTRAAVPPTLAQRTAPVLDGHDYPRKWGDYIGQDSAKRMLQVAAKSAKMRKAPLDHVLIAHPQAGIGKTALCVLIAEEMRTTVRVLSGSINKDMARLVFADMKDGDIVLWDEFHQAMDSGRKNAEWLLTFLQDGYIPGPLGPEEQPKITIIAATTDPQKLPPAIVSRFPLQPILTEYDEEEAARIAQVTARKVLEAEGLPALGLQQARIIATAANRNPRAMRRLLVVLRDMTLIGELTYDKAYDIAGLLRFQGLTEDGLDETARRYLLALATEFGGKAGIRALSDRIAAPSGLGDVEKVLLDRGFIARTGAGRTITKDGIRRFRELEVA